MGRICRSISAFRVVPIPRILLGTWAIYPIITVQAYPSRCDLGCVGFVPLKVSRYCEQDKNKHNLAHNRMDTPVYDCHYNCDSLLQDKKEEKRHKHKHKDRDREKEGGSSGSRHSTASNSPAAAAGSAATATPSSGLKLKVLCRFSYLNGSY